MNESFQTKLWVNKSPVDMNPFVEEFLSRIAVGAVASLKGAEDINSLEIHQDGGNVRIEVNGKDIPLTPFPTEIISSTLVGLVSSLKGITKVDSLLINVTVQ
jgi:hypothetical protein